MDSRHGSAPVPGVDETRAALQVLGPMMDLIPMAGEEGADMMLLRIAMAESADELDKPWESTGLDFLQGRPLVVTAVRKAASDYPGGIGWYLLADVTCEDTGETMTVSTGATSVVAQLARANAIGALPLKCEVVVADKATRNGNYPQHLKIRKV